MGVLSLAFLSVEVSTVAVMLKMVHTTEKMQSKKHVQPFGIFTVDCKVSPTQ